MPYKDPEENRRYQREWIRKKRKFRGEEVREAKRKYYQTNEGKAIKKTECALRRARQKNAAPTWTSMGHIKKIYKECPTGKQVDHIVPLTGKKVSGLHVPENLQYLTPKQNQKKGNKFDG